MRILVGPWTGSLSKSSQNVGGLKRHVIIRTLLDNMSINSEAIEIVPGRIFFTVRECMRVWSRMLTSAKICYQLERQPVDA